MSLREKLNKIADDETSSWLEETSQELTEHGARKKSRQLALRVLQLLHLQGLTQTQLAERMQVSRQHISKIVRGQENFTFETIDKLEKALGVMLITIESTKQATAFEQTRITWTIRAHSMEGKIQELDTQVGPRPEGSWIFAGAVQIRNSTVAENHVLSQEGLDYHNA